jgi:hypothetical protein
MTLRTFPLYLAVPVIAGVILWYFARSTPDVRYSLSERIPVSFTQPDGEPPDGKAPDVVQQLEVKNVGSLQADNILVKIRGGIKEHILNKHAEMDAPKVTNRDRSFEVQYPALPPGASFQLSLKSNGDGIPASDVSVSDSRGPARAALSAAGPSAATFVSWSLITIYFVMILWVLRLLIINLWKSGNWRKPVGEIVSSARPLYMSEKEWKGAVSASLKESLRGPHLIGQDLSKHPAYQLLQLDAPAAINNEADWKAYMELAVDALKKDYMGVVNGAFTEKQVLDLLGTQGPKGFPESQWAELEANASNQYVKIRMREYLTQESALKCLQEVKPSRVFPDAWETLLEHWQDGYYKAKTKWVTGPAALEYLREAKPEAVPVHLWEKLSESWEKQYFADVMNDFWLANDASRYEQSVDKTLLTPDHRKKFELQVQRAVKRELAERRAILVEGLLEDLLEGKEIPSKGPAELLDQQLGAIRRIQAGLNRLRDAEDVSRQNAEKASELKALEGELIAKREKVERQLKLIHEVLTDPNGIDRIEDSNDLFAPGNFDNLKKLVQMASKPQDGAMRKRRRQGEESG